MKVSSSITILLGGVTAFTAMSALGWKLAGEREEIPTIVSASERASRTSDRPARANGADMPGHVRRQLSAIRATNCPAERMRLTIDLVNGIPHDDFPRWIDGRWFDLGTGFDMALFKNLIDQRWEHEDPEGMIQWSFARGGDSRGNQVLMNWSENDPQRVIDYLNRNPNPTAEGRLLPELAKNHPLIALARLQELLAAGNVPSDSNGYLEQTLRQLAEKSPEELFSSLDSLPPGWQIKVESALSGELLKHDFEGEIKYLHERPDGLAIFNAAIGGVEGFRDKVLAELHNLPASWIQSIANNYYMYIDGKNASQWIATDLEALGLSAERAFSLRRDALGSMAHAHAEEMFKLMGAMDLGGNHRQSLIANAFSHDRSPEETDRLLALLSREDRAIALAVQESRAHKHQINNPAGWLDRLASIDKTMDNQAAIRSLTSTLASWDSGKLAEFSKQFATMPADRKDQIASMLLDAGYDSDLGLKGELIRHVATQEKARLGGAGNNDRAGSSYRHISLASNHVVQWAQSDPVAASRWVRTLPEGDTKRWAQKNLASNWALYDPEAANTWVKSLPVDAGQEVLLFMKRSD